MRLLHKTYPSKNPLPPAQRKGWLQLLDGFAKLLDEYNEHPQEEVAYWYGERALTGLLAAAAWRLSEGWSLEEFTAKGRRNGSRRGDLWIGTNGARFTVEAKYIWIGSDTSGVTKNAFDELNTALKQLCNLEKSYQVGVPVALCYIVPELSESKQGNAAQLFSALPKKLAPYLKKKLGTRMVLIDSFWYGKKNTPSDEGKLYPGVVVVGVFWPSFEDLPSPRNL